jgi:hypothetical protein
MKLQFPIRDAGPVNKNMSTVNIPINPAIDTAGVTAVLNAVAGVTLGTQGDVFLVDRTLERSQALTQPSSTAAQRTNRWLVSMIDDTTGERFQFTLPTADLANHVVMGSHNMDVSGGSNGEALVTALETHVRSDAGNTCSVESIIEVSRGTN